MKKNFINNKVSAVLLALLLTLTVGCGGFYGGTEVPQSASYGSAETGEAAPEATEAAQGGTFTRNGGIGGGENIEFTPWDTASASGYVEKREKKPYTLMVYMNGSDLESEEGAATDDLIEILESELDGSAANLVLLTGGANRWQNDIVPSNECALWEIDGGLIYDICGIGLVNMGDPGTLASFIDFGIANFPADKYGLIMWDHGGGSIVGYGHDEKFLKSNLTLADMEYAFKNSAAASTKLEFLGFDSCLMASAEMALVASGYAKYLIASEDLEPGGGWDYAFLSAFNQNPGIDGGTLGKAIVDGFMGYYGNNSEEILTLSVMDLSKIEPLSAALDNLMKSAGGSLAAEKTAFKTLATKRNATKTFGEGSPRDNDCDMVDIGDMCAKLKDLYPEEARNVLAALSDCVVYSRHNSDADLKGLSVYYIYGGKQFGRESLGMYRTLNVNPEHTRYMESFFGMLTGSSGKRTRGRSSGSGSFSEDDVVSAQLTLWQPLKEGGYIMAGTKEHSMERGSASADATKELWPKINGKNVCMFKVNGTNNAAYYAVPAEVNANACDIIVLVSKEHPEGKILGTRREEGIIIQKGYDDIKDGDMVSFVYRKHDGENSAPLLPRLWKTPEQTQLDGREWHSGEPFKVSGGLKLEWGKVDGNGSKAAYLLKDINGGEFLSGMEEIKG